MIPPCAEQLAGWTHVALRRGNLARGRLRKPLPDDLPGSRLRSRLARSLRVASFQTGYRGDPGEDARLTLGTIVDATGAVAERLQRRGGEPMTIKVIAMLAR